jgi:hypothetical protein
LPAFLDVQQDPGAVQVLGFPDRLRRWWRDETGGASLAGDR